MKEHLITMTPAERKEFLNNNAHSITEGQYFRKFDDEDLQQTREDYTSKSIELHRLVEEFKAIREEFKRKIKAMSEEHSTIMSTLMQSGEWLNGKQYGFDDQIRGVMEFYDESGQFISSRRLLPNERQLTINSAIASNTK
jgi:hypothetical protein